MALLPDGRGGWDKVPGSAGRTLGQHGFSRHLALPKCSAKYPLLPLRFHVYIYNHMYVKVYQCTVYLCICMCILLFLVHSTLISLLFPCDLPCFPFILSSTPFLFPLSPLACPIDSHLISNLFPSDSQAIFGLLFATAGHRNRQKRIGKRNIIRIIRRVVGST